MDLNIDLDKYRWLQEGFSHYLGEGGGKESQYMSHMIFRIVKRAHIISFLHRWTSNHLVFQFSYTHSLKVKMHIEQDHILWAVSYSRKQAGND